MNGEPNGNRWRFTKDISLSLLLAFIVQTASFIWVLAGQNAALNNVIKAVSENQITSYTKEDARHEREFIEQRLLNASIKIEELTRRLAITEAQMAEVTRSKR